MTNPEEFNPLVQHNLARLDKIQDLLITQAFDAIPQSTDVEENIAFSSYILALPTQFERVRSLIHKHAFTMPIDVEFVDTLVAKIPRDLEDDTEVYEETTASLLESAQGSLEQRIKERK